MHILPDPAEGPSAGLSVPAEGTDAPAEAEEVLEGEIVEDPAEWAPPPLATADTTSTGRHLYLQARTCAGVTRQVGARLGQACTWGARTAAGTYARFLWCSEIAVTRDTPNPDSAAKQRGHHRKVRILLALPVWLVLVAAVALLVLAGHARALAVPALVVVVVCIAVGWGHARPLAVLPPLVHRPPNEESMQEAFRSADLLKKDQTLTLIPPGALRDGRHAWTATVDLQAGVQASKALRADHHERLASAFAVGVGQLVVTREPTNARRLHIWASRTDPFDRPPLPSPLLTAERTSVWHPIPFGRDARGNEIPASLVETTWLIAAKPGMGKSTAARAVSPAAILDPHCVLIVADGARKADWSATRLVAHTFVRGCRDAQCAELLAALQWAHGEMDRRGDLFDRLADTDPTSVAEAKLTPAMARTMPPVVIFLDEVHRYFANQTHGATIRHLVTELVKSGRAPGIWIVLLTQRPSHNAISAELRAVLGARFALACNDAGESQNALGQAHSDEHDASKITRRGVGIYAGSVGGDTDVTSTTKLLPYWVSMPDFVTICQRGRELREQTGTLCGQAAASPSAQAEQGVDVLAEALDLIETQGTNGRMEHKAFLAELGDRLVNDPQWGRIVAGGDLQQGLKSKVGLGNRTGRVPEAEQPVRCYHAADVRQLLGE